MLTIHKTNKHFGLFCGMDQLLIVGGGLAGAMLAYEAKTNKLPFRWIISEKLPSASLAAYGMCNPVQFRNKVPAWRAEEFYQFSKSYFLSIQTQLGIQMLKEMPIHHLIVEEQECVLWRQNVESTTLWKFTNGEANNQILPHIGPGFVASILIQEGFFLSIPTFVSTIRETLKDHIEFADFNHDLLEPLGVAWNYNNMTFKHIIFSEGVHGFKNPFFTKVPFNPCKGEILVVKIAGFPIEQAIHKKIVLIPLGNDVFVCGATYGWDDLTFNTSINGRLELEEALRNILGSKYAFEVIEQRAGVRPSISDRRPLVGWHPAHSGIGILNGFGSMGLMVGPSAAKNLIHNILHNEPILSDWDINRFRKRLLK